MKKTEASKPVGTEPEKDMLSEYRFDYSKARPNRFATRIRKEDVTITLDPDVSAVFKTSKAVNTVLRALIETMPGAREKKRGREQRPK